MFSIPAALLFLLHVSHAVSYCLQPPDEARLAKNAKTPLVLDGYSWMTGELQNEVVKILMAEVLSYPVQIDYTAEKKTDRETIRSRMMTLVSCWARPNI